MQEPLPIVLLSTGLGHGGAETQLVRLATSLDRRRWRPRLVSMLPPAAFGEALQAAGLECTSLGMRRKVPSLHALAAFVGLLRDLRPRVLVSFMFHANLLARLAGRLAGVPVVISSIRTDRMGGRWRELALRATDRHCSMTTVNSARVAASMVARGAVPAGRIRVIPNAVVPVDDEPALSRPELRRALGVSPEEFVWLAVGRLEEAKDYPNLLAAFATLAAGPPRVRLLLAGEGPLRLRLEEELARRRLRSKVSLLGFRRDVPALLRAADGFVLSSAWEGLPNALMEAMSARVPVVATCVGGVEELVAHGETGLLVRPGDPDGLAAAMRGLEQLPAEERAAMAQRARRHVTQSFGLSEVVGRWEALFFELLAGAPGSGARRCT